MLREVVVEVTAVHQVEDEAELVRRLEGIRHAYDEGTVLLKTFVEYWPSYVIQKIVKLAVFSTVHPMSTRF